MEIRLSTRAIVRIITFLAAIVTVLLAFNIINARKAHDYELQLQNTYTRALMDLVSSADSINSTLSKEIYSGTSDMQSTLSAKLWRDAWAAKIALSQLPLQDIHADKINKFLAQVGNYAIAISKKSSNGENMTLDDYTNLAALYDFSNELKKELWQVENKVQTGRMQIAQVENAIKTENTKGLSTIGQSFTKFEEDVKSYPTLIYDGPFSDNILDKEPTMTKGMSDVDVNTALSKASEVSGIPSDKLKNCNDENGKMPSYCFEGQGANIAVTKNGGLVSYFLKNRTVNEMKLTVNDAMSTASAFLLKLGVQGMVTTYYETYDNICTINFAYSKNGITVYPDLIKVSVAMDNGEITGYDARGFIVNHKDRDIPNPAQSEAQAKGVLSPLLSVERSRLTIIPTDGMNEVLCYEFLCTSRQGTKVLVYVNAKSLKEEQILILFESETGVLTQ